MNQLLTVLLTLTSINAFAAENKIAFESITPSTHGVYWVKDVRIENGGDRYRIKYNQTNKKRICESLGFSEAAGSRSEYSLNETVVSINRNLEITRINNPETNYISNLNCIR
jgi:hypothetical protein